MSVCVVVPWRPGCGYRERAWAYIQERYAEQHPGWEIVEARAPDGPWCKAAAVNPAVQATGAEIIVQADADCWCDGLLEVVAAVEAGAGWAMPHAEVRRLTEQASEAALGDVPSTEHPLAQPPYRGTEAGGVLVARRHALLTAPLDCRFIGWGQDDESHAMALRTLLGEPWRGSSILWHFWHPPQERMTRRRGSQESWGLRFRYAQCNDDPAAMAALIEESRVPEPLDQPTLHDRSSLAR